MGLGRKVSFNFDMDYWEVQETVRWLDKAAVSCISREMHNPSSAILRSLDVLKDMKVVLT